MENRVYMEEDIFKSTDRIPFLKRFLYDDYSLRGFPLDYMKINEYMGFMYIEGGDEATSESINKVLIEAEKRGDLN